MPTQDVNAARLTAGVGHERAQCTQVPVVFGRQAWEQMTDAGGRQPQPAAFVLTTQQHLRDRDADQLGITQQPRPARPLLRVGRT
ncbi:hypothetical protein GCM10027176_34760 [Actinoallomurus bryophytorum]